MTAGHRQGGSELVGDVGQEPTLSAHHFLDAVQHFVEGPCECPNLVVSTLVTQSLIKT